MKPDDSNIPPADELWPECGLYNAFLKYTLYFVDEPNVGVKSFLIFNVVILDKIELSVASIKPVSFEYLNTPSNWDSVFVL